MPHTTNSDSHPSYIKMICDAIQSLTISKTGGVSKTAISNYIQSNYNGLTSGSRFTTSIDKALKKGIGSGVLEYQKYSTKKYKISSNSKHQPKKLVKSVKNSKSKSKTKKITSKTKAVTPRNIVPKRDSTENRNMNANRPFIEYIPRLATMSARRRRIEYQWVKPRAPIEQLQHKTRGFIFDEETPLYFTSQFSPYKQYLLVLGDDGMYKYDIEQDKYIKLADYPCGIPIMMKIVLNQDDHKLYMFTLNRYCQYDHESVEDINHNLWCLDLNTEKWTNCNFHQHLLLRQCRLLCVGDEIHIFYRFSKGIHHEKLSLCDFHFSAGSNLTVKRFPTHVTKRQVNVAFAKVVHFKDRNEMVMFGAPDEKDCVGEKDNVWICNLNDDCKWKVFDGIDVPLDGMVTLEEFNVISVLDHFVLLFHLRSDAENWYTKYLDIWCLDLLAKQWYFGKKHLPAYVGRDLNGLIGTGNEYIYYMDKYEHDFRFSFLDIIPDEMKSVNGELCKRLVYGFVRQRVEAECELNSNVPTTLKNLILTYFKCY